MDSTEKHNKLATTTPKNSKELFKAISDLDISGTRTSVMEVRNMGGMPLSSLVKKTDGVADKSEAHKFIQLVIVWMCQYFGVVWNDLQIKESSRQLYENYFYFSQYDWRHFMSRVTSGYFGKMFGAFNTSMLMEYAAIHSEEWLSASEGLKKHELDLIGKQEEKVVDFTKMIEDGKQSIRNKFHQENVDKFKESIQKPDNFTKPS